MIFIIEYALNLFWNQNICQADRFLPALIKHKSVICNSKYSIIIHKRNQRYYCICVTVSSYEVICIILSNWGEIIKADAGSHLAILRL